MKEPSPHRPRPGRGRNRTRQRERILQLLRGTDIHPSAAWIHEQLRPEFPRLSLATVYRNLEILSELGHIDPVSIPGGAARYDGNLDPHQHFICDACGRIQDVELRVPSGLTARLKRKYRLSADRVRIDFFGLCAECTPDNPSTPSESERR